MEEVKCRGYAGSIPVYCAHDKVIDASELKPNPRNPNKHPAEQIELLAKIIRVQGWRAPVTVSTRSGLIVRGHGRHEAATLIGCPCPVDFQHYESEEAEIADLVADNRIAELADVDNAMLAGLFADIDPAVFDVELTGYNEGEFSDIISSLTASIQAEDMAELDAEIDPPETPTTVLGDVWQLGSHRLICGDSTSEETIAQLMAGEQADLLLTDPPYNVEYTGKTKDALTIENDSMADGEFRQFLIAAFKAADSALKCGGAFYIWHADSEGFNFRGACHDIGWQVRQCLVWVKNTMVLGRQDYQWKHEPCLYGWKAGAAHYWGSDRKQTTVLEFDKPSRNGEHPTMKPVALFQYQVENSTARRQVVLDTFGGSGTTMVACEASGRVARLVELDPRYCDVIVKRYMQVTGKSDVTLVRGGKEIPLVETGLAGV